ncbi:hypothetical protein [Ruminococcus sp.]|uniref:hypothetical protein n=1 Tax=Ruminococcus sp. TaxID=41978 RepID=UPI002C23E201|nr:hypothetical protein [Ruminococcus sp.]HNZ97962.1 hypothetical protein [Ruminococcus sp.]HOH88151.1 hypothetical protein [Ruminococcus sp.]
MKKIQAFFTALMTGAALTGCSFGASIDTLMSPPKLSVEEEQIYSALTNSIGTSISLKYPKSGKYLSAFIIEDIDGDGDNEALVFYERNNHAADENPLRIKLLEKEGGKWSSVYDTAAEGTEIEKVMISKLGSSDRINIIIGTGMINRSEKNVSIYNCVDGVLEEPIFSDSYAFFDVKDLDMDGEMEFLRLTGASGGTEAAVEAYKLHEDGTYDRAWQPLSGSFTEFDNISYGKVGSVKTGLYIDAVSGTGSIQTDVVYMDDGALHKVFNTPEESADTVRPAGCTCFDVDGDGSPEIPVQYVAPGYEDSEEGEKLRLTDWMQVSNDFKLEKNYTSYYSVNDGYIFLFPDKWENMVTVKRDIVNDEIVFCTYGDEGMGRKLLHIFCAEDQPSREDRISGGYMLMHTKGESAYLACLSSEPDTGGDGLSITAGDAAVGFRYRD